MGASAPFAIIAASHLKDPNDPNTPRGGRVMPRGIQPWMHVLAEYAKQPDPCTWDFPGLRVSVVARAHSVQMLLLRGYIAQTGLRREPPVGAQADLHSITPKGLAALDKLPANFRPLVRNTKDRLIEPALAARTVAEAPVDVFDMARVHKPWDKAAEEDEWNKRFRDLERTAVPKLEDDDL